MVELWKQLQQNLDKVNETFGDKEKTNNSRLGK